MREVWKYKIRILNELQTIRIPKGATVLSVGVQDTSAVMWAEVDPEAEEESRYFLLYGTGEDLRTGGRQLLYRGTIQIGFYVYHLYELHPPGLCKE